jgi:hypoxanthine phosphoribosyltransferase
MKKTSATGHWKKKANAFVIMPFGNNGEYSRGNDESNHVYEQIIKPGVEAAFERIGSTVTLHREVDRNAAGSITSKIIKNLAAADVVIADITGRNPNVFLELGIRYSLRNKTTILMAQAQTAIPFDIKSYKYMQYDPFKIDEARRNLRDYVLEGLRESYQSDSIVFDYFNEMSVVIPGVTECHGSRSSAESNVMQWTEYVQKVQWAIDLLSKPIKEGKYTPDAIVGVSNGGLIVADLVGREIFQGKPILSLWANRFSKGTSTAYWFFDNCYNQEILSALKKTSNEKHAGDPIRVLLVDDHLGTGATAVQACEYIKKKLGSETKILFFPLVSRRKEYLPVVEDMLPYNYKDGNMENGSQSKVFQIEREEFIDWLNTDAIFFPYMNKEIHKGF